ncbi:MAG: hypothetical protein ACREQN_18890 [Candidatus Binataceae bacterium]
MVKRPLPLILVLLAGCALAPPLTAAPRPVMVNVPVYQRIYCKVPQLRRPALPIAQLTPTAMPADTIRAYAATVVLLKGAVKERDAVIAGCAAPQPSSAAPSTPTTVAPRPSRTPLVSRTVSG